MWPRWVMFRRKYFAKFIVSIVIGFILAIALILTNSNTKVKAESECDESGTLGSSQTWGTSCIYVVTNVTVPDGITLTIDPNAIVKIVSGDQGIQVNSGGTLDAEGTTEDLITFTSQNNDAAGGAVDGSTGTPAVGDYDNAIVMNGGTIDVTHAEFNYATEAITDAGSDSGSNVTVTDSSFENEDGGVDLTGTSDLTASLESNTFDLGTSSSSDYAVDVNNDQDLSGIVLSGAEENSFTGTTKNSTVEFTGTDHVPYGSTWDIDSDSASVVYVNGTIDVDGTVGIDPGAIIKVGEDRNAFDVQDDGVLNAQGNSGNPIVFTSYEDDSLGGDTTGDGDTTGSAGDYNYAIRFELPDPESDVVKYVVFKYAYEALSIGPVGTLDVSDTQFTHNVEAFEADMTTTDNPELGSLEGDCSWPYDNDIEISNSWFGSSGYPGDYTGLSSYLDSVDIPDGYDGLKDVYDDYSAFYDDSVYDGDNALPWTLFSCGIPDTDLTIQFPVTPVDIIGLLDGGKAGSQLWTESEYAE